MSLALQHGILQSISTDTVRAVMRSYVPESISPPLHRSSYGEYNYDNSIWDHPVFTEKTSEQYDVLPSPVTSYNAASSTEDGSDDPVKSWKETCKVLESSLEGLVDDAIQRKVSLVLEGVSVLPSRKWCDKFTEAGGTACGVLLTVSNEETHKNLLLKRGFITGNAVAEEKKLKSFDRVRLIQDEMIKMAKESGWVLIEQRVEPDPLDVVNDELFKNQSCQRKAELIDELEEDCLVPKVRGNKVSITELVRAEKEGTIGKTNTAINDLVRAEKEHMEAALAAGQEEQIEI